MSVFNPESFLRRSGGFIKMPTPLTLQADHNISGYQCTYHVEAFDEALYKHLRIPMPETLRGAVKRRKAEYLVGRILATMLLAERGETADVARGAHRQPVWPQGWCGSITHRSNLAVCCVAPSAHFAGIGADVEHWLDEVEAARVGPMVLDPHEIALLSGGLPGPWAVTLGFSGKESLFKAVYPKVLRYFGFDAARWVGVDWETRQFCLMITQDLASSVVAGGRFYGRFELQPSCVVSMVIDRGGGVRSAYPSHADKLTESLYPSSS